MLNKITIILRNYDMDSVRIVAEEADKYSCFDLEIALNSSDAFEEIKMVRSLGLKNVKVGAGTVLNLELLKAAKDAGAQFVLSPVCMTKEMIDYCKANNIVSVPGAFSPSEIQRMKEYGADVIKVFPASELGPKYLKDVMAPLNHLPIMVVGGVNASNVSEYFEFGAEYAGIGSGLCNKDKLKVGVRDELAENLSKLSRIVEGSD